MSRTAFAFAAALAALALTAIPAAAASNLTARSSGVQAVKDGPGHYYATIGKLADQERVRVTFCTRGQYWCEIRTLDGELDGWVEGSYLIGSGAKNAVTPFEFSFNPMDPLDLWGGPKKR